MLSKEEKLELKEKKKLKREQEKLQEKEEARLQREREEIYRKTIAFQKESQKQEKIAPKDSFISLQHINKIYGNRVQAVFDFNLEIQEHEFIVFVGPSGCGKSTTLRMIAGLESITSGDLYIDGVYSNELEPKDRNVSMVFQNYALYPHMSVYANMAFGLKMRKVPKAEIDERVKKVAKILQLEEYLDRKPRALSGGQCQRVALGRAIVRDTKVFLMDEPLSNLDAKLRVQMRSEIVNLHESLGSTTIYVTHDQTEAMTMATRIVVMSKGVIQQIGTPREVYNHPSNLFVATFIGSPSMNIVSATYNNGKVILPNGYEVKLPASAKKAHDAFYNNRIDELNNLIKEAQNKIETLKVEDDKEYWSKEIVKYTDEISEITKILKEQVHEIKMGIRPENIHKVGLSSNAKVLSKPFKIEVVNTELLGQEYYIHTMIGEDRVISKVNAIEEIKNHSMIELQFDVDQIHLFDVKTTRYIL
ncbi:MAG: ATP-binding cassette domain-containing protein [Erysipelotrichales bacterium]|nr:ATP-binding cassette domain-containing protein [Erysipelotrichales bacterium]